MQMFQKWLGFNGYILYAKRKDGGLDQSVGQNDMLDEVKRQKRYKLQRCVMCGVEGQHGKKFNAKTAHTLPILWRHNHSGILLKPH